MKKRLIFILFFVSNLLCAGNHQSLSEIPFCQDVVGKIKIDLDSNPQGLEMLVNIIKDIENDPNLHLAALEIQASMFPEKGKTRTEQLCLDRAKDIERYIKSHVVISDDLISTSIGIAWVELKKMVSASDMKHKDEVSTILDNVPEETRVNNKLVDSRNKQLMDLAGGHPYFYMREHFFPKLIYSGVVISYCRKQQKEKGVPTNNSILSSDSSNKQYLNSFTQKTTLLDIETLLPNTEFGFSINLESNSQNIEKAIGILKDLKVHPSFDLTALEIKASIFPEKGKTQSELLCLARVKDVEQYVRSRVAINDSLISSNIGIGWAGLRKWVLASNMQHKDEIIKIIDSIPEETRIKNKLIDSRNKQLMDFAGGDPYIYMREHVFPRLIESSVVIMYTRGDSTQKVEAVRYIDAADSVVASAPIKKQFIDRFVLKTNLLYFAALAPNVGFEYHFSSKNSDMWSIGLSVTLPLWCNKDKHQYYRLPFLEIGSKYYLGRTQRHNLGLYMQGGKYELKSGDIGSIGGFGGIGFGYGYLLPIGKSLSLNFEVGVGYIYTNYKQYSFSEEKNDYYYIDHSRKSKKKHLFMPTKAGVTLVWKMGKIHTKEGKI